MAIDHGSHSGRGIPPRLRMHLWIGVGVIATAFFALLVRLYALQIMRGEELMTRGRRNFVQSTRIPHDRGIIYDRLGRILVDNRPTLDLQIIPAFLGRGEPREQTLIRVAEVLRWDNSALSSVRELIEGRRGLSAFKPLVVGKDLDPSQVEAIEADRSLFRLDGVDIVQGRRRTYLHGALAAHLLGYVNEIDGPTLNKARKQGNPEGYQVGDLIGRDGVERVYESELRGLDGYEKIVVDAKGRRLSGTYVDMLLGAGKRVPPEPGQNVFLTIDLDLQRAVERAFDGRAGSVVVIDVRTGAVLAIASIPAFDPNLVSSKLAIEEKERLDSDVLKPWLNRSIQGQYVPGSTFKVITALAALEQKVVTPKEKILCPGYFRIGKFKWRCHREAGHGMVDLRTAIKVSCDTYFYNLAGRMGIDPIADVGRTFGLGQRSGIPLRGEKPGLMPDEAFHDRVDKARGGYQRGMAVNTSIGQGALLVTPLQLALVYAAIANGGKLLEPQIVDRIETADFRVTRRFFSPQTSKPVEDALGRGEHPDGGSHSPSDDPIGSPGEHGMGGEHTLDVAARGRRGENVPSVQTHRAYTESGGIEETVEGEGPRVLRKLSVVTRNDPQIEAEFDEAVQAGLLAVTSELGGTAFTRRSERVTIAGKTGTAQVVSIGRRRLRTEEMEYFERDHAWFAAYAPADEPEIAVVVLNEHSGHGGPMAVPIAVRVFEAYFDLKADRGPRARAMLPGANE